MYPEHPDEFTFEHNHHMINTIKLAANAVKVASVGLPLRRRTREFLFQIEDRLDEAIEFYHDLMQDLFSDDPGYRKWGMKEGWLDPETEEEEEWYDANVNPERDHASAAEKANRSREWQEATLEG